MNGYDAGVHGTITDELIEWELQLVHAAQNRRSHKLLGILLSRAIASVQCRVAQLMPHSKSTIYADAPGYGSGIAS